MKFQNASLSLQKTDKSANNARCEMLGKKKDRQETKKHNFKIMKDGKKKNSILSSINRLHCSENLTSMQENDHVNTEYIKKEFLWKFIREISIP